MDALIPIVIFVGIAGLIGGIWLCVHVAEKKRTERFQQTAGELGLAFQPQAHGIDTQHRQFELFSRGRARKCANLISGDTDEVRLAIFDYRYTTGSGKNSHTHKQTVLLMESAVLDNPSFTLRPANLFDKIGGVFGMQDINFDEHREFSHRFTLKSRDEERVREYFDLEILDFFAARPGICVEAAPGKLICYRPGRRTKADGIRDLLEQGYQVFGLFADRHSRAGTMSSPN